MFVSVLCALYLIEGRRHQAFYFPILRFRLDARSAWAEFERKRGNKIPMFFSFGVFVLKASVSSLIRLDCEENLMLINCKRLVLLVRNKRAELWLLFLSISKVFYLKRNLIWPRPFQKIFQVNIHPPFYLNAEERYLQQIERFVKERIGNIKQ